MVEAAICDGDYVVIRKEQTAENGDIVAALIDGEATVKTLAAQGRKGVATAAQPQLRSHRRHERHHPREGDRGAATGLIARE